MLCEHGNIAPCVECDIEPLKAENATLKEENERLKTRVAELAAPDVQGEVGEEVPDARWLLDQYEAFIEAVPVGQENKTRGASAYNWHRAAKATLESLLAAAPVVQGEPVAALLIGEPEYTKQGWEPGDWDIEPNATTIEAFAKLAKPGAYQLYLAPQPAEQQS